MGRFLIKVLCGLICGGIFAFLIYTLPKDLQLPSAVGAIIYTVWICRE